MNRTRSIAVLLPFLLLTACGRQASGTAEAAPIAPRLVLLRPVTGTEVQPGGEVRVEAVAQNVHTGITFFVNGRPTITITRPPFATALLAPADRDAAIQARALVAGHVIVSNTATVRVRPPEFPVEEPSGNMILGVEPSPYGRITSPPYGSVYDAPATVRVVADAVAADGVEDVKVAANGALVGTVRRPPFVFEWHCRQPNEYKLVAYTRNKAGQVHESTPVLVIVR